MKHLVDNDIETKLLLHNVSLTYSRIDEANNVFMCLTLIDDENCQIRKFVLTFHSHHYRNTLHLHNHRNIYFLDGLY